MYKKKNIYILFVILIVISVATLVVSNIEEKKEDIKTGGEVVLEIDPDSVTNLSWTIDKNTLSFTKDDSWLYDDDNNYPLDETKIDNLVNVFKSFTSTYVIENVEDYDQYGLSSPICTINITTEDQTYTIKLGDESKMDKQRYVDIGDGNVYLTAKDPYDSYDIELNSLMLNDSMPVMKEVNSVTFSGNENYRISKTDGTSLCEDDVYFVDDKALDTSLVNNYIAMIKNLSLTNSVTYNVTDEELEEYGFNDPDLIITMDYTTKDSTEDQSLTLYVASNVEELKEYNEASDDDKDKDSVTRYVRLNDSKIIYTISSSTYNTLTSNSYDDIRHQEVFPGDMDSVTSMEISLEGTNYTFTKEDDTWKYNDTEIDIDTLKSDLTSLDVDSFTTDTSSSTKEVSITLNLDNENYPTYKMDFYRYDGNSCIVYVDDKSYAYVSRSDVVDIIEAIHQIVLN